MKSTRETFKALVDEVYFSYELVYESLFIGVFSGFIAGMICVAIYIYFDNR